jgi:hypothetical protein
MLSKKEALQMTKEQMMQAMPEYNSQFNVAGTGAYFMPKDPNPDRSHGDVVSNIHTKHGKGFWSHIQIHEDDYIKYKLFNGTRLAALLYKLKVHEPRDEDGLRGDWRYIQNQENANAKLEATLGKTFLVIDEDIREWTAEEQEGADHRKFIKGIAKTDPENLKMIAGLKGLHDGMEAPLEDSWPTLNGTVPTLNGTVPTLTSKGLPAAAWNYQPGPTALSVGSEAIIKVDPEKNITFGIEMEKAIKKVLDTDIPETGKAP